MKKILAIAAVCLFASVFSTVGFAERYWDRFELTAQEKADFTEYMNRRIQITQEFLSDQVADGFLSQAEADARIVIMRERLDRMQEEYPRFTDEQWLARRTSRQEYHQKMIALEMDSVKKAMENGSLDKERGERILEDLKMTSQDIDEFANGGYGQRGYGRHGGGYGYGRHGGGYGRGGGGYGGCGRW